MGKLALSRKRVIPIHLLLPAEQSVLSNSALPGTANVLKLDRPYLVVSTPIDLTPKDIIWHDYDFSDRRQRSNWQ